MVRIGERFYTSLGFAPLPQRWSRSLFVRPRDRESSATPAPGTSIWVGPAHQDDHRPDRGDFSTIHWLRHNFYQRAYKDRPVIFGTAPTTEFHEAIGDDCAVRDPDTSCESASSTGAGLVTRHRLLMSRAESGVPAVWRRDRPVAMEGVLGRSRAEQYNTVWWDLRQMPGIAPPASRGEEFFDPERSFTCRTIPLRATSWPTSCSFSSIALAQAAGCKMPLHRMLDLRARKPPASRHARDGDVKPWPAGALTGSKQMDASAILDYFAPLKTWLDGSSRTSR